MIPEGRDEPRTPPVRLAVVNQAQGGGATAVARRALEWGPPLGFEVRYFPERAAETWAETRAALEAFAPHVVHLHCWYNHYPFAAAREIAERWPAVLTVHDTAVVNQYGIECWECFRNPWCLGCPALGPVRRWRPNYRILDRLRKRRIARGLRRMRLVYPSEWMRRRLARSEWSRCEGEVIPYGIDAAWFGSGCPARERFGFGPGPVILFSGHMYGPADHRKGLPDLLSVFPQLRARFPELVLAVAGQVVGIPSVPGVVFLGDVSRADLPALYASADVFCLPSRGDNLPVAILEAMAAGLPVIATSVGGIPEEVVSGETGLLVPPSSPAPLAAALERLLSDPALRSRFSAAGRARVRARFSHELESSRLALLIRCQARN